MADSILASVPTKFKPWRAPNFVLIDGVQARSVNVRDIPEDALRALAQAWLDELFTKAGYPTPSLSGER